MYVTGTYERGAIDMSNFECKGCGECCSNYLPLRREEIKTMRKLAKIENRHPLRKDWYERCPFLNNSNKCDIYENRPLICKEYSCYNFENNIYNENAFKDIPFGEFNLVDIRKEIFGNKMKE